MKPEELRERLAEVEHIRWCAWQKWMHGRMREAELISRTGPGGVLRWYVTDEDHQRWERQIATPYAELSEAEKDSDREQVDRYWGLIEPYITTLRALYEAVWGTTTIETVRAAEAHPDNAPERALVEAILATERVLGIVDG